MHSLRQESETRNKWFLVVFSSIQINFWKSKLKFLQFTCTGWIRNDWTVRTWLESRNELSDSWIGSELFEKLVFRLQPTSDSLELSESSFLEFSQLQTLQSCLKAVCSIPANFILFRTVWKLASWFQPSSDCLVVVRNSPCILIMQLRSKEFLVSYPSFSVSVIRWLLCIGEWSFSRVERTCRIYGLDWTGQGRAGQGRAQGRASSGLVHRAIFPGEFRFAGTVRSQSLSRPLRLIFESVTRVPLLSRGPWDPLQL